MRRVLVIALFLALAALKPLAAQRGAGHGISGGHGSFAARSSGSHAFGGGRNFSSPRSASGYSSRALARSRSFRGRSFQPATARGLHSRNFRHSRNLQIRTFGFRNNCLGFRCGWGYGYPWAYAFDPYWWWDYGSSYDEDREREIGLANEMNRQSLDEERMRGQGDPDPYAKATPAAPPEEKTDAAPATVLVFHDQHKREIQNYAIVGQTLWNFAPQHTERIPLSDLDLPATTQANQDRGVDFHLPAANEGQ